LRYLSTASAFENIQDSLSGVAVRRTGLRSRTRRALL
jgi:hypothetical protein